MQHHVGGLVQQFGTTVAMLASLGQRVVEVMAANGTSTPRRPGNTPTDWPGGRSN